MINKFCKKCNKPLRGRQRKWCSHICEVISWQKQKKNQNKVKQYKKNYIVNNIKKRRESIKKYDTSKKGKENRKKWIEKNRKELNEKARIRSYKYRDRLKTQCSKRRAIINGLREHYTKEEWIALKEKYNNKCLACNKTEKEILLTPDHIIPLIKGGKNTIDNIQPLCISCNRKKNDKQIIDYRLV